MGVKVTTTVAYVGSVATLTRLRWVPKVMTLWTKSMCHTTRHCGHDNSEGGSLSWKLHLSFIRQDQRLAEKITLFVSDVHLDPMSDASYIDLKAINLHQTSRAKQPTRTKQTYAEPRGNNNIKFKNMEMMPAEQLEDFFEQSVTCVNPLSASRQLPSICHLKYFRHVHWPTLNPPELKYPTKVTCSAQLPISSNTF